MPFCSAVITEDAATQNSCPTLITHLSCNVFFLHMAWDFTCQTNVISTNPKSKTCRLHAVAFAQAAIVLTKAFLHSTARHVGAQCW